MGDIVFLYIVVCMCSDKERLKIPNWMIARIF